MIAKSINNEINNNFHTKMGRPLSNHIRCKGCGDLLTLRDNARETKKGSGRPRSKCTRCENHDRYTRKVKVIKPIINRYVKKKYEEPTNKTGQRVEIIKCLDGEVPKVFDDRLIFMKSHIYIHKNLICDECGGPVYYNYLGEPICVNCGLIAEGINYDSDAYNIRGNINKLSIDE
jgi:hypothetical protein